MNIEPPPTLRERAFLDEMHGRAMLWTQGGLLAAVIGAILLVAHALGHMGVVLGFIGVLGGPIFVVIGLNWFWLLPAARQALEETPHAVRLDVKVYKGGYGGRNTKAQLWSSDSDARLLAKFSQTMHWQTPRLLSVDRVPARVYGVPKWGAAVVVSCDEGIVAGRIWRSHVNAANWD